MQVLNVLAGKSDNASVLPPDAVLASQAKDDGFTARQHSEGEIARLHDVRPWDVGTDGH
jgi:hypothetical protein